MGLISENYNLIILDSAQVDIENYIDTIIYTYAAPMTAKKHYDGLFDEIRKIKKFPILNPIRYNVSLQKYGCNVRRSNYKKMAIIYTVNGDTVFIHRVVPSSMITGL